MDCIDVKTYVCRICGYVTDHKPFDFPNCPACQCSNVTYSSNTKGVKTQEGVK